MFSTKGRTALFVALIILGAFLLAIVSDLGLNYLEGQIYPDKYKEYVQKYAAEYNVPEYIIFAVIKVESDFDADATSSKGAMGLMQMVPSTFTWLSSSEHLNENLSYLSVYDPEVSIRYGTYYLRYLFLKFHNWDCVFAAYNGGEGRVAKWLADPEYSDGKGNLTNIPIKETRNYVKKVNSAIEYYKDNC